MFAVLGATGQLGGAVLHTLASQGFRIRSVLRDSGKGEAFRAAGAEVVVADAHDADALAIAFVGVEGAFVMNTPSYASPDLFADAELISA